ncbi:hypothetical protein SAMN02910357_01095 [Succinivibrio dextrinosolvens]|uniref:hypothetical protein n=1 Tax=Succinivibrio dextrinosolvens TaxID=83771 RepID=UPI0008E5FA60|nr:hypothetical protein [Succinivibrio dextrinosolvens]SFS49892.1 hypothetical protein SAMN02910357_01095 [Succinivibrio dextrinosolvens]
MGMSFRHTAGFGKRMEFLLVSKMLMEGLDVYLPLVDDHGVDCVIKNSDGTFIEVQIKARSDDVKEGDGALFSAITHEPSKNFYFVFYSKRLEMMWIMSSEEFLKECVTNKTGKNAGKHSIWFNGMRTNSQTGKKEEYCKERYFDYIKKDFSIFY